MEYNNRPKNYTGVDICKLFFALVIPFLHIQFSVEGISILQQYISRLGVPLFFAASGFFLSQKLNDLEYRGTTRIKILLGYEKRIARITLVWVLIYMPFFVHLYGFNPDLLQKLVFKTPGYLWFLVALLFAAIPFCLVKNRFVLYIISLILFVFGTLFSDSYSWLTRGVASI